MAIIPTGAIYKSLVFDGEDSRDYGVYITGEAVYNAPERDVEMISIPGRNGSFALDKGRFQNIEVSYPAGIFADNETDFAQGISDFRNFLCSRNGYVRLTDEYNPDEYRMAVYKSGLDVSPAQLKAGEFDIVFDCKPQRFLTSGEEPVTIGEWRETETASGSIVTFEAVETDAVKSLSCDIEPIQSGSGTPSPDNVRPISGHTEVVTSVSGVNVIDDSQRGFSNEILLRGSWYAQAFISGESTINSRLQYLNDNNTWVDITTTPFEADGFTLTAVSGNANPFGWMYGNGTYLIEVTKQTNFRFNTGSLNGTRRLSISNTRLDSFVEFDDIHTHTTSLGRTVYGGTLDVVSGVLTVTKAIVDLGDLNWRYDSGGYFQAVFSDDAKHYTSSETANAICSSYAVTSVLDATSRNGYFGIYYYASGGKNYIRVHDEAYTDATAFISAVDGVQLVYELATAQTVQLTAQEVELLVGLNQVWANSGDVSVEYGTAPNVLVNPTLFESSPMLEVEGYGNININDDTVTIQNEVIGTIPLTQKKIEQNTFSSTITCSVKLPVGSYQAGDKIYDPDTHGGTYQSDGQTRGKTGYAADYSLNSIWEDAGFYFEAGTPYHRVDTYSQSALTVYVKGTSTAAGTFTPTRTITFDYDGVDTFTVTIAVAFTGTGAPYVEVANQKLQIFALYVDSTKPVVEGTIYIDLDIGEAWVEDGGEVSPANNVVAIPAEMPKLKSGVNTITYDNTIDYTKITPRWWKI